MAADLDVLITSNTDPLLFLEYHRQFTHSLIFIPIGGLLCALALHWLLGRRWRISWKQSLTFCTAGYATHALLDACTSYGTQLFWPFSSIRISWSNVSIVDPLFTLPLICLVLIALIKNRLLFARAALIWVIVYLGFGLVQRDRAESAAWELAKSRHHAPSHVDAKPAFGTLLVWKIIYETDGHYHVDGIRLTSKSTLYPGKAIPKLDLARDFPWLDPVSQQAKDVERFRWFSNDFLAVSPDHPLRIIDARYSMLPNETNGLWMIELDPEAGPNEHITYIHNTANGREKGQVLWNMIMGNH